MTKKGRKCVDSLRLGSKSITHSIKDLNTTCWAKSSCEYLDFDGEVCYYFSSTCDSLSAKTKRNIYGVSLYSKSELNPSLITFSGTSTNYQTGSASEISGTDTQQGWV